MNRKRRRSTRVLSGIGLTAAAVATIVAVSMPAQAQEGVVRLADSPDSIEGSYIVVLKDKQTRTASALTSRYGGRTERTFDTAVNGYVATMSDREARRLAADKSVAYVQANQRVKISEAPPSYGLDRLDQRDLPLDDDFSVDSAAENVTAFVIDTGVDADHETFEGRVVGGFDAIDGDTDPDDLNGHGTHVAGTIGGREFGVAKGIRIVPVRVLDEDGDGSTAGVIAGIEWVVSNLDGPSVANLSLGGPRDDALDEAVRGAIRAGVTFAVAAGNDGEDAGETSPARVVEAITVAASDADDNQAVFSNFGPAVDLYAPGVDIPSSFLDGEIATLSGTSMATPHVTGAAALILATDPQASPARVQRELVRSATRNRIQNASPGTPNRLLFTG
ncbi:Peptidase inhibitor I9 [Actinokineospora alba]|uniref:Peptidase inhibitor I9 n=1 Tax=Actinokineospora alba TaxID=504798 RepID=A0A1H0TZA5_9PSEU|nr:S8 family peptidase [Actinokineospora alba]TDP70800.1 peptidase inhibitor I9 [Actinokineospora alba]SDJ16772.1 Peptidase inhibitor I9 [Actinokineospora alba]SDP59100.1 Peptidase inhibitor I9 [Actinokineospora alba]